MSGTEYLLSYVMLIRLTIYIYIYIYILIFGSLIISLNNFHQVSICRQLFQVDQTLQVMGVNEDLHKLKADLLELIKLTEGEM